jgi:hypothetical protein
LAGTSFPFYTQRHHAAPSRHRPHAPSQADKAGWCGAGVAACHQPELGAVCRPRRGCGQAALQYVWPHVWPHVWPQRAAHQRHAWVEATRLLPARCPSKREACVLPAALPCGVCANAHVGRRRGVFRAELPFGAAETTLPSALGCHVQYARAAATDYLKLS